MKIKLDTIVRVAFFATLILLVVVLIRGCEKKEVVPDEDIKYEKYRDSLNLVIEKLRSEVDSISNNVIVLEEKQKRLSIEKNRKISNIIWQLETISKLDSIQREMNKNIDIEEIENFYENYFDEN